MKIALASVAALAAALVAAAPASAATFLLNNGTTIVGGVVLGLPSSAAPTDCFQGVAGGGCDAVTAPAANGSYTSLYEFQLNTSMVLTYQNFGNAGGGVTFQAGAAQLYFNDGSPTYGTTVSGTTTVANLIATSAAPMSINGSTFVTITPQILAAGKYTLALTGNVNNPSNTVTSNFQFSAAPEPATWGMMVLGFGAVGAALRTSRRKVVFA